MFLQVWNETSGYISRWIHYLYIILCAPVHVVHSLRSRAWHSFVRCPLPRETTATIYPFSFEMSLYQRSFKPFIWHFPIHTYLRAGPRTPLAIGHKLHLLLLHSYAFQHAATATCLPHSPAPFPGSASTGHLKGDLNSWEEIIFRG